METEADKIIEFLRDQIREADVTIHKLKLENDRLTRSAANSYNAFRQHKLELEKLREEIAGN